MSMTVAPSAAIPESAAKAPVHNVADILRAIAQDPAIAEAVRQHVLGDEIRRLPAAFKQLAATLETYMAQTNRILAELQAGQAELQAGQAELQAGQAELQAGQAEIRTDVAALQTGQEILRAKATVDDARKMAGRICRLADLRRPRFLDSTDIYDLICDGDTTGIPDNELHSCEQTDLVLRGVSKTDHSRHYVIIEGSAALTAADFSRIRRNADHFAQITGCATHAVAIGKLPPSNIMNSAQELRVHCLEPTNRATRPT